MTVPPMASLGCVLDEVVLAVRAVRVRLKMVSTPIHIAPAEELLARYRVDATLFQSGFSIERAQKDS
jgi:hypothetical protein